MFDLNAVWKDSIPLGVKDSMSSDVQQQDRLVYVEWEINTRK